MSIVPLLRAGTSLAYEQQPEGLAKIASAQLFIGDEKTAFRDPAVLFHKNRFYLFFTLVKTEENQNVYSYTAMSTSTDLRSWSSIKILTPKDQQLDFSSPGNVIRYHDEWVLCLQTYPRPNYHASKMPQFGTGDARIYIMRSKDLTHWSEPELLKVKGPNIAQRELGRMIDPYLLEDKDEPGKYWCFYKQDGVSMSYSYDLENWTYAGKAEAGENACVLVKDNFYYLMHSPKNGMSFKTSKDLKHWENWGNLITLNQTNWNWAKGRITAGAVLDLTNDKKYARYLLFFHGSGPLTEEEGDFDKNASIGIAWSKDLKNWNWPKQ